MSRKQVLLVTVCVTCCVGVLLVGLAFVGSLQPTRVATDRYVLRIPMSEIPSSGFTVRNWQGDKVFVSKAPQLQVFRFPFAAGRYLLPDTKWSRPLIPCEQFGFVEQQFQCTDSKVADWFQENARWNNRGVPINSIFEPMISVPRHVHNGDLVVGVSGA